MIRAVQISSRFTIQYNKELAGVSGWLLAGPFTSAMRMESVRARAASTRLRVCREELESALAPSGAPPPPLGLLCPWSSPVNNAGRSTRPDLADLSTRAGCELATLTVLKISLDFVEMYRRKLPGLLRKFTYLFVYILLASAPVLPIIDNVMSCTMNDIADHLNKRLQSVSAARNWTGLGQNIRDEGSYQVFNKKLVQCLLSLRRDPSVYTPRAVICSLTDASIRSASPRVLVCTWFALSLYYWYSMSRIDHRNHDSNGKEQVLVLLQSSPSTVTEGNQCKVDVTIFVHRTVESSLQFTEIANFCQSLSLKRLDSGERSDIYIINPEYFRMLRRNSPVCELANKYAIERHFKCVFIYCDIIGDSGKYQPIELCDSVIHRSRNSISETSHRWYDPTVWSSKSRITILAICDFGDMRVGDIGKMLTFCDVGDTRYLHRGVADKTAWRLSSPVASLQTPVAATCADEGHLYFIGAAASIAASPARRRHCTACVGRIRAAPIFMLKRALLKALLKIYLCPRYVFIHLICTVQDHDGKTARLARRSDKALSVRVRVARIAPSLFDLGRAVWSNAGMKGRGKLEIAEETHRLVAWSSMITTCENPGATPPGIELSSPRWEASSLTTKPPQPPHDGLTYTS
ncbi:hypothetical protein PR048_023327 [Dryococelus australis]|uniref:Uncharacterized protein n=1 Tax=Dryococelus australis TaxID=614101 RepID=A0ABQ9GTS6_9NEOP|nr:hypothetical protein PR048_023327 [Dryococelus australis]